MEYTISHNVQFGSLEITFDGKPAEAVRAALKGLRYRWHGVKKCWYGYSTEEEARAAIDGAGKIRDISKDDVYSMDQSTPEFSALLDNINREGQKMKEQYINALKAATVRFLGGSEIGADRLQQANYINSLEDVLHDDFRLTWEDIEALENSVMH